MDYSEYPVTKQSMDEYARNLFGPISRDECVTTIWVPLAGRRRHSRFIINYPNKFRQQLPTGKNILVYVDLINLRSESSLGYLQLVGDSLLSVLEGNRDLKNLHKKYQKKFGQVREDYSDYLVVLEKLLAELSRRSYRTVLFLAEIDNIEWLEPHVFGNLKSLREKLQPRLQYVFLIQNDLRSLRFTSKWNYIYPLILQNIVHIPLLDDSDTDYMIDRLSRDFTYIFTKDEIQLIKEFGGNHPYLLKASAKTIVDNKNRNLKDTREDLLNSYSLESICMSIGEIVSQEMISVLKKLSKGTKLSANDTLRLDDLIRRRILVDRKKGLEFMSLSFRKYVENIVVAQEKTIPALIKINKKTDQIFFLGKSVEENFTNQEQTVLKLMVDGYDRIVSRDEIANSIWGEKWEDKYSDWAIDQIISKLRKKLTSIGVRNKLVTVRGLGYKLKN